MHSMSIANVSLYKIAERLVTPSCIVGMLLHCWDKHFLKEIPYITMLDHRFSISCTTDIPSYIHSTDP